MFKINKRLRLTSLLFSTYFININDYASFRIIASYKAGRWLMDVLGQSVRDLLCVPEYFLV
jgi:hypothetical protein